MMETANKRHPSLVGLNVGGTRFMTSKTTLEIFPNTFFTGLLNEKFTPCTDELGYIFIDRNPKYFESILDFMRTGVWDCPQSLDFKALMKEAQYYGLHSEEPSKKDEPLVGGMEVVWKDSKKQYLLRVANLPEVKSIASLIVSGLTKLMKEHNPVLRYKLIFASIPVNIDPKWGQELNMIVSTDKQLYAFLDSAIHSPKTNHPTISDVLQAMNHKCQLVYRSEHKVATNDEVFQAHIFIYDVPIEVQ